VKIIRMSEMETFTTPKKVQGRKLLDRDGLVVMNLLLKPGEEVPSHKTPVNVLFQIVKGEGTIEVGEEKGEVQENDLVYSPKNIPHALEANKDKEFHVLVIKLPQ